MTTAAPSVFDFTIPANPGGLPTDPKPFSVQVDRSHPIIPSLAAAVPLIAHELDSFSDDIVLDPGEINRILTELHDCGEAILYRTPGKSARAFNALAAGIARLARCPGGVRCFGMHFEYRPGKWSDGKHGVPV